MDGVSQVMRKLDGMGFHSSRQLNIVRRSAKKGAQVLADEVKSQIIDKGKFPYIDHIKRSIKAVPSKSRKRPGANVFAKGRDVFVSPGKGRKFWKLSSYQRLVYFGNFKTPNRPHKFGSRRGVGQGDVKKYALGYNPYVRAYAKKRWVALEVMKKSLSPEIEKEFKRIK